MNVIKIFVDEKPSLCVNCLFSGGVKDMYGKVRSGCKLLNIGVPFEISLSTRLGNCPLIELKNMEDV